MTTTGWVSEISRRISRGGLDLVFPPQCALCGAGGTLLCNVCSESLPQAGGKRCDRCWMPSETLFCGHCRTDPPAFESLRAAYVMEGGARRLVHELKYEGLTSLAEPMGALLASTPDLRGGDMVVPVPLHARRERSRGYNQASELARTLARTAGLPCDAKTARRLRDTTPLAKAMSRDERRTIVAGAFAAEGARVEGKHIFLIDDVCTTGATLDACTRALLDAGAASVRCLVWARAD